MTAWWRRQQRKPPKRSTATRRWQRAEEKKTELEDDVAKLTAKFDKAAATSAKLKEEVKELQAELAELAKLQAEMDKIRAEQNEAYLKAKADLELGLEGVRKALEVLRNYYGSAALLQDESKFGAFMQQPPLLEKHVKATGAGNSIVGILEVGESDFANNLVKEDAQETVIVLELWPSIEHLLN